MTSTYSRIDNTEENNSQQRTTRNSNKQQASTPTPTPTKHINNTYNFNNTENSNKHLEQTKTAKRSMSRRCRMAEVPACNRVSDVPMEPPRQEQKINKPAINRNKIKTTTTLNDEYDCTGELVTPRKYQIISPVWCVAQTSEPHVQPQQSADAEETKV